MTMHSFITDTSLAQPLAHGGSPFGSCAQIVWPTIFVPTMFLGTPAQVDALLCTSQIARPGAYMIVRASHSPLDPVRVRVGEGGNVAARLANKRDEWLDTGYAMMIVVTCSHPAFDKTCAEVLEGVVTASIEASRSAEVERERAPKIRRLSIEVHRAMDDFVQVLRTELERRGIFLLTQQPSKAMGTARWNSPQSRLPAAEQAPEVAPGSGGAFKEPVRTLSLAYGGLHGRVDEMHDHVVVHAGTEVSLHEVPALQSASRTARRQLIDAGIIGPHPTKEDRLAFRKSHSVGSLTTAARICTGSTKSGTQVWRQTQPSLF